MPDNPTETIAESSCDAEELFVRLESPLLLFAMTYVNNSENAQDIVQEAFMRFYERRKSIQNPKAWLYRTVHNSAINFQKRANKTTSMDASENGVHELSDEAILPDDRLERIEAVGYARLLMDELGEPAATVVRLKFEHALSYKEIADVTGLTVTNVGFILHKTIQNFNKAFEKGGYLK
jgi:RNA polymerase sigma-70 factor (ECF subfamily)